MSLRNTARSVPAMIRIGFLDAVAYRAEMVVWLLATTMPLVMLALFSAVAREAPIGRFGEKQMVAYFLATFVVRQVTGAWIAWQMNMEVREGTLAIRLLRPVHPLVAYSIENIASIPLRGALALPIAIVSLVIVGTGALTHDPIMWLLWVASMIGAWLISLLVSLAIGSLALFMESSGKVMDVWLALFFVFSGYLVPVELFPPGLRAVNDWLPFRYQMGLPVEIMTAAHDRAEALALLGRQWMFVVVLFAAATTIWKRGLTRFAAFGG